MRHDLLTRLYDRVAGIAGDGPNPGASARSRYVFLQTILEHGWH
jgi:hypothetical protein